jgi:hypothetical protein
MAHTKKLPAAAVRGTLVLLLVAAFSPLALGNGSPVGAAAAKPPVATSVRTAVSGAATLITIEGTAPMPYTVRRPDALHVVVELPGVDGSQLSPAYGISSPLVESLTVKHVLREGESVSSLQVATARASKAATSSSNSCPATRPPLQTHLPTRRRRARRPHPPPPARRRRPRRARSSARPASSASPSTSTSSTQTSATSSTTSPSSTA